MSGEGLPKPSFEVLIQVLATPCFVHLGLVENPGTGRAETDLEQAKWAIDLLHVLYERVDATMSKDEREHFDHLLHHVRDAYSGQKKD